MQGIYEDNSELELIEPSDVKTEFYIRLIEKATGRKSNKIKLEDVIYNQNEIEFEFGEYGEEDYETLPYKDFLFFRNDYDVEKILEIGAKQK